MRAAGLAALLAAAALSTPACNSASTLSRSAADAQAGSGGAVADAGRTGATDGSDPHDLPLVLTPDAAPPPAGGTFGVPCTVNAECLSGYCIEAPDGGRMCTQLCGECPKGFQCTLIGNTGADEVFICTVDVPDLCKPCQTDRECDDAEDLCLSIGNGHYCGEDCSDDGLCPEGYECQDALADDGVTVRGRQCVPAGGEGCLPCRDADGDGYGDGGDCLGADCDDNDPLTHPGAPEICDGKDNNCNALPDEAAVLVVPDDLPPCLGLGLCAGAAARCVDGAWTCGYPETYTPGPEPACDGLDENCDGRVDEAWDFENDTQNCGQCGRVCAFPNATAACVNGECVRGDCENGWHDLDPDLGGCEYLCVPSFDGVEICDGLDNDCDGAVDEDFDAPETCDGFDNNCDGQIDETFDLQADPQNCGVCGRSCAAPHRAADCFEGRCVGDCEDGWHDLNANSADGCEYACFPTNGGVEACDDIDNDCDGAVDNGFNLGNDVENCGACGHLCVLPNALPACVGGDCFRDRCEPDFVDLDGQPDNGCEYRCTVTNGGVELCDGLDNNCDGNVDEGIDLLTDVANCGACDHRCTPPNAVGRCAWGSCAIGECVGGFLDQNGLVEDGCEYGCFASNGGVEACDGIDNDCDGLADEDFDLTTDVDNCGFCGRSCAHPDADWICDTGHCAFQGCAPGHVDLDGVAENGCEYLCTPQNGGVELCNGVDDNCDGRVDEGVLNACGACGPTPDELCDGVDNNCDGRIDEGLRNACGDCGPPADEICDFIDNNCDGQTDEGLRNRCNGCGPEPAEVCDGVDNDCDGLADNHGVCGPYMEQHCRWFVGWSDVNQGPGGASGSWGDCPNSDKAYSNNVRCVGTRRDGNFMHLDTNGDVDDNDRLAFGFLCDDGANAALARYVDSHCAVYLGYADVNRGPDGTPSWGACPPAINSDVPGLRCTSSGYDRLFRKINLEGNVNADDDLAVAFKCVDAADPGRAWSLQQSVSFYMGWADVDGGPGDGSPVWGVCPANAAGEAAGLRCTSTMGDGNFHRLDLGGDVNQDDDFGFALRARPAP